MKKQILIAVLIFFTATVLQAQQKTAKAEVLYFKANLACCKARACAMLESDVQQIVEKNFKSDEVAFREVKLADEANKELVEKYKAQSQTVVIVSKKKKKEKSADVSDLVKAYVKDQNKENFEKQLVAKIKETIK